MTLPVLASRTAALALLIGLLATALAVGGALTGALKPEPLGQKAALLARLEAALAATERAPTAGAVPQPVRAETAAVAGARLEVRLRRALRGGDAVLSSVRVEAAGDPADPAVRLTAELTASHAALQRALYEVETGPVVVTARRLTVETVPGEPDRLDVRLTLLAPWRPEGDDAS